MAKGNISGDLTTQTSPHTFHQDDAFVDVLLVLALDEVPGVVELDLVSQCPLCLALTVSLLVLLEGENKRHSFTGLQTVTVRASQASQTVRVAGGLCSKCPH